MILLSATMFILGLLAFLDTIFNYGSMFRFLFSGLLIFMSVWVFIKARSLGDLFKTTETGSTVKNNRVEPEQANQANQVERRRERKPQTVGQ